MKLPRITILILGFVVFLTAGCKRENEPKPPVPAMPAASVRVEKAEAKKHLATEETVGTVRAKLQARLEAKVPGRIQEMRAAPGQLVKSGEILIRLEVREIRARLDQALALQQQAASDLKRFTALLQSAAATQAEFEGVQARARVAEAAVQEAQTMLSYTDVAAPFDGVVTRKLADVGDQAAPGKPLLEVEDPAHLRLEADIPETIVGGVKLGSVLAVRLSSVAGEFPATVSEIAPAADAISRSLRVKLDLPSAPGLRAGQFGRVAVPVAETMGLRVPESAVVRRGQLQMVFVIADRRAEMRLVKTGKRIDGELEIASGLSPGESIAVENAASLIDGQLVEIKP